jgi:hypothetical protein
VDAIAKLARRYDLLLLANAAEVVDLRDPAAVEGFIDVAEDD